jgi:hypothetical protein
MEIEHTVRYFYQMVYDICDCLYIRELLDTKRLYCTLKVFHTPWTRPLTSLLGAL